MGSIEDLLKHDLILDEDYSNDTSNYFFEIDIRERDIVFPQLGCTVPRDVVWNVIAEQFLDATTRARRYEWEPIEIPTLFLEAIRLLDNGTIWEDFSSEYLTAFAPADVEWYLEVVQGHDLGCFQHTMVSLETVLTWDTFTHIRLWDHEDPTGEPHLYPAGCRCLEARRGERLLPSWATPADVDTTVRDERAARDHARLHDGLDISNDDEVGPEDIEAAAEQLIAELRALGDDVVRAENPYVDRGAIPLPIRSVTFKDRRTGLDRVVVEASQRWVARHSIECQVEQRDGSDDDQEEIAAPPSPPPPPPATSKPKIDWREDDLFAALEPPARRNPTTRVRRTLRLDWKRPRCPPGADDGYDSVLRAALLECLNDPELVLANDADLAQRLQGRCFWVEGNTMCS